MNYAQQTQAAGRQVFPDLARAFALIGIALVNVGLFSWPAMGGGYLLGGLETPVDNGAHYGVVWLFLMKSYTLFSFMFGVGFAYQIGSAQRAGVGFAGRYWRRIIGLFFFAAINIIFLFQGDILFIYAVLGTILFLFRNMEAKSLISWAIWTYVAQALVLLLFAGMTALGNAMAPEDMVAAAQDMAVQSDHALLVFGSGTFIDTIIARTSDWAEFVPFMFLMQGIGAMSFFLFGLAAVRMDTIARPEAPFWRICRRIYLPIGLVGSGVAAWTMSTSSSMTDTNMMLGMALVSIFSPLSTAGYLGLIAKWAAAPAGPVKTFLARGGTASLTAYLLQGLLFTLIFYGFGLGLYAKLGAAACIAIALGVALFSIAFTSVWRLAFQRGPTESVLRRWTYLGG